MRCILLAALGLASALGLPALAAGAPDEPTLELRQPVNVQALAFDRNAYLADSAPEPAAEPAAPAAQLPAPAGDPCAVCPQCGGCASCCCDPAGDPPKPWTIPQPCVLQALGIKLGGWLEQGYNVNGHGRGYGFNGPVFTDDWNGEYQMNQFWMFLDRPADTSDGGWAVGGHFDAIYGTDWRYGICHGLEDRINGFDRQSYGLVIPQFYLELAYDRLSIKLGHMEDYMGYENVPAVLNPLYSHCYAFVFSEPILITGMMAEYKLTDRLTLLGGLHRGWMMFEDNNNTLDFIGGFRWTGPQKRLSLNWMLDTGPQDPAGQQDRFVSSFILKFKVTEPLEYILQQDWGLEHNATNGAQALGDAEWFGINQYLLYKLNPKWMLVGRCEWFRDDDGVRVFGPPDAAGIRMWSGAPAAPGFAGNFYEVTLGVNWRPHPNFVFRPEVRWDWYDGSPNIAGLLPFNGGSSDNQFLFGVDMIMTY